MPQPSANGARHSTEYAAVGEVRPGFGSQAAWRMLGSMSSIDSLCRDELVTGALRIAHVFMF